MTVMVQLHVTATNVLKTILPMLTSTAAVNVISSGKDLLVNFTMPHATQFVLAATAAQHAIAKSVWSTHIWRTTHVYVTKTGTERIAQSGLVLVMLTACNPTTVMDQKIVTVTTVLITLNLMTETTVYV
jgi:hypothetical protein